MSTAPAAQEVVQDTARLFPYGKWEAGLPALAGSTVRTSPARIFF